MNNVCYDLHVIIFDVILDKMLLLLLQISVYSLVKGVHCVCACLPLYAVYVCGWVRAWVSASAAECVCLPVRACVNVCVYVYANACFLFACNFVPSS